jgi:hypothetical protein
MPSETTPPLRPAAPDAGGPTPPLCVDLDGTLIRTDLLLESFLLLARQKPWLLKGRSHLKQRIAEAVDFAPELLPYDTEFLGWLREAKAAGRPLVLATASNRRLAQPVADHLGLFDLVLASDATTNLKGRRKLEALQARFGAGGFDYAADARADLPVWREARAAIPSCSPPPIA